MNTFSCIPCDKYFNGIKPYEAHLFSKKHKKKVGEATGTVIDSKYCEKTFDGEMEPFIVVRDKEYWCSYCKTALTSVSQVKSHISGTKHLKSKVRSTSELPKNFSKFCIASNGHVTVPYGDIDEHNHFSFHSIEVDNALKDIKIMAVNDPIVF